MEATAFPAVVRQNRILTVAVPVGNSDAELTFKSRLLACRECLGSGEDTPDRETTEDSFAHEVYE